jgi:hypothetical protein
MAKVLSGFNIHLRVQEKEKQMTLALTTIALVFVANAILGAGLLIGVFGLMERSVALGAGGGVVAGLVTIYAESRVGEMVFNLTVGELKTLVLVAAAGGVLGVVGTVLTIKPEI